MFKLISGLVLNNIYGMIENQQPIVPGAAAASGVYSNFRRDEGMIRLTLQVALVKTNTSIFKVQCCFISIKTVINKEYNICMFLVSL